MGTPALQHGRRAWERPPYRTATAGGERVAPGPGLPRNGRRGAVGGGYGGYASGRGGLAPRVQSGNREEDGAVVRRAGLLIYTREAVVPEG